MKYSNLRPYVGIAVGIVLTITLFSLGAMWQCSRNPATPEKTETVTKTDTILQWRTKEVKVDKPVPVTQTITKTVHDTLPVTKIIRSHSTDTVYAQVDIPVTTSKYAGEKTLSDSVQVEYQAAVSGYKPSLDSLQFKVTYPERTINTSTATTSVKKNHWGIGPSVGCGYGLTSKKFDAWLGLSVTYSF